MKSSCPVEVGDTFYRSTNKINIPDRIKVKQIYEHNGETLILGQYIYHEIGPFFERVFNAKIFNNPDWVIEKRSVAR